MANNNVKVEILDGPIDGANQEYSTAKIFTGLALFYNGILYSGESGKFAYSKDGGNKKIILDYVPELGDGLMGLRDE